MINEMKEDIQDKVTKHEFDIIAEANDRIQKEVGKFCSKDELTTRINVMINEIQSKLADRPTVGFFRKTLGAYDTKIDMI
jgi:hypothetical protein